MWEVAWKGKRIFVFPFWKISSYQEKSQSIKMTHLQQSLWMSFILIKQNDDFTEIVKRKVGSDTGMKMIREIIAAG